MFYEEHNEHVNAYQPKLKKISRRNKKISIDKEYEIQSRYQSKNYDLIYSRNGYLTSMLVYYYNSDNKLKKAERYHYTYHENKQLHTIFVTDVVTNQLCNQIFFEYTRDNQIEEERVNCYYNGKSFYDEIICYHEYKGDYHKMLYVSYEYENNFLFETWYDALTGTVDKKVSEHGEEMLHWNRYVYNKSGLLIREYDLNDKGIIIGESEYFYQGNKCIRIEYDERERVYETITEKNEKHCTVKSNLWDGELVSIEEETKEFYDE
jgi:hypothetical protein